MEVAMDILSAAEAELATIERKLADMHQLALRRDQLRAFISIGRTLYAPPVGQAQLPEVAAVAMEAPSCQVAELPRPETKKRRIVDAAAALIAATGPMQTRDLIAKMEAQGIDLGGGNKVDTVSVALSRTKDRFKSDRAAGGWVLVQPHKEATPLGAPTPAGS
jgi:hypothetical protein